MGVFIKGKWNLHQFNVAEEVHVEKGLLVNVVPQHRRVEEQEKPAVIKNISVKII